MTNIHYTANQDNDSDAKKRPFGGFCRTTMLMAAKAFEQKLLHVNGFVFFYLYTKYKVGDYIHRKKIVKDLKDLYKDFGLKKPLTERQINDARRELVKIGWIKQDEYGAIVWIEPNYEIGIVESSFRFSDTNNEKDDTKSRTLNTETRNENTQTGIENTGILNDKPPQQSNGKRSSDPFRDIDIPDSLESSDDKTIQSQRIGLLSDKEGKKNDLAVSDFDEALPDAPLTGDASLQHKNAVDVDMRGELKRELIKIANGEDIGSNVDEMIKTDYNAAVAALKELKVLLESGVVISKRIGKFVKLFQIYTEIEAYKSSGTKSNKRAKHMESPQPEIQSTPQPENQANEEQSEVVEYISETVEDIERRILCFPNQSQQRAYESAFNNNAFVLLEESKIEKFIDALFALDSVTCFLKKEEGYFVLFKDSNFYPYLRDIFREGCFYASRDWEEQYAKATT